MELQERLSPEYSIRYVQLEIENHPQEGNLPDMGIVEPVSYTHLDVYKRQHRNLKPRMQISLSA